MYMKVICFIYFLSLHDVLLLSKIFYLTQTVILLVIDLSLAIAKAGTQRIAHVFSLPPLSFSSLSHHTNTMRSLTSTAQCHLRLMYLLITNVTLAVIIFETIARFSTTLKTAQRAFE
jgi:Ni,Fe-hydrogenase maturation factor